MKNYLGPFLPKPTAKKPKENDNYRHKRDIDRLQCKAKRINAARKFLADILKLTACIGLHLAEANDFVLLLLGENHALIAALPALKNLETLLRRLKLGLKISFLLLPFAHSLSLKLVNLLERTIGSAAATNANKFLSAGELLNDI
jgi:hypothetical protein